MHSTAGPTVALNSIKELLEREVLFSRDCEKDSKKDGICITEK